MSWSDLALRYQTPVDSDTKVNSTNSYAKFEYYTLVIGFEGKLRPNFTDLVNYQPRGYCRDESGGLIPNKWAKTNKAQQYRDEELKPYGEGSVDDTEICRWNCPATIRSAMSADHRTANDAIKMWLGKNEAALWWHDGNSDLCSKHGGPHLHIIGKSTSVGNGLYRRLNTGSSYQPLVEAVKRAGGYIRSQGVKSIESLVLYLNTPPRIFMGSMCTKIGAIRAQFNQHDIRWTSGENNDLEEWFDDCSPDSTECGGGESGRPKRNAFQCTEEVSQLVARLQARKHTAGYDAGSLTRSPTEDLQSGHAKRFKLDTEQRECQSMATVEVPKSTSKSKYVATLEKIMLKYNKHDKEALASLQLEIGEQHKVALFIQHLTRMGTLATYASSARDSLKIVYQKMTMMDIAKRARFSNWFDPLKYYSVAESLHFFCSWVEGQGWSKARLVSDVQQVYDMQKTKINSLVMVGPSNTGKSLFFNEVLQKLHPMYALYTCEANEDRFAFEEFPGKRVAFAHEGTFGTQQLEMAKQICGGQECEVGVKHKQKVKVYRLPFFITSNRLPWILAQCDADKLAFRNRCFFYETHDDPEVPELKKNINPGIWYYLLLGNDAGYTDKEFNADELMTLGGGESPVSDPEDSDYEIE